MMRLAACASTVVAVLAAMLIGVSGCDLAHAPTDVIVMASGADLESANPLVTIHSLARQIQRYALFVTLARYDSTLQPEPYAARRWRWSPDRRELTFVLAPGLRWHDGVVTTVRDVAFTLDAARDPATGFHRHSDLAELREVVLLGDSAVMLRFERPQERFPLVLCELPLVPAHLLRDTPRTAMRQAAFSSAPVGNGPFRFASRRTGQRWVFERNPNFPALLGGPPRSRRLVIAVVDEATTKFAGLVGGELHVAGISPSMASLVARDRSLRVIDYPVLASYGIVYNTHRPPFDDARVRRAVALAIDRQRIVEAALAGYAVPAFGPVPDDHPLAIEPDRRKIALAADSLLDDAGWRRAPGGPRERGGHPLVFELLTVGSADNAIEQLIQADLSSAGIRVEIRQREMATFLAEARADEKRFDALFTGVPGDLSLAYLSSMFDSRLAGGALDYGGFHTARLDSLLAAARTAASDAARRDAWHAVQRELATEMPVAWIYHARGVQGLSRRLRGVRMDLRGELVTLTDWWLDSTRGQSADAR